MPNRNPSQCCPSRPRRLIDRARAVAACPKSQARVWGTCLGGITGYLAYAGNYSDALISLSLLLTVMGVRSSAAFVVMSVAQAATRAHSIGQPQPHLHDHDHGHVQIPPAGPEPPDPHPPSPSEAA